MKLVTPILLITLLVTIFPVEAEMATNEIKGEAIITVDSKTYSLPLKKCYSASNIDNGKTFESFIMSTHQSRRSKEPGPRLSVIGSKAEGKTKASYDFQVDGGYSEGGTRYQGKIPYERFRDNELAFEGNANSLRDVDSKAVKALVSFSIKVTCND